MTPPIQRSIFDIAPEYLNLRTQVRKVRLGSQLRRVGLTPTP